MQDSDALDDFDEWIHEYEDIVLLTNEEGEEVEYMIVAIIDHEGRKYAALASSIDWDSDDDELDLIPYLYSEGEDGERQFDAIENDDDYESVCMIFSALLSDDYDA